MFGKRLDLLKRLLRASSRCAGRSILTMPSRPDIQTRRLRPLPAPQELSLIAFPISELADIDAHVASLAEERRFGALVCLTRSSPSGDGSHHHAGR